METTRRAFMAGAAAAGMLSRGACAATTDVLTPEQFGARGDGRSNDTDAFAALSAAVNALGGGVVVLKPVTYLVGKQTPTGGTSEKYAYRPSTILHFVDCAGPVTVRGNGARLRCADGLRFGTFDPRTGLPTSRRPPFKHGREVATPYEAMIRVERCSGTVVISELELDGNVGGLRIGGPYGNSGWQIPATGIQLINNKGAIQLSKIYAHHHALDGLTLYRPLDQTLPVRVSDVRAEYNGRQGCSITGGRNYSFERCRFLHTGKGGLRSAPGAGVDLEAGRYPIRDVSFAACVFSNNSGTGVVGVGNTEGATFNGCTFVGTTSRAAWPSKPRFRFHNCVFAGSIIRAHGDPDPTRAAQFHDCIFSDDPALSPTGQIFLGRGRRREMAILPKNQNVLFNRCKFKLAHEAILPLSTSAVIYADCEMSQRAEQSSRTKGTYIGVNRLTGNIDLVGSIIRGEVILNGTKVPRS